MAYEFMNREVDVADLEFSLNECAWAIEAYWADTNEPLSERELEVFNDVCQAELYETAYENAAADAYDRAKDARWN